jgi:hypothetical protein
MDRCNRPQRSCAARAEMSAPPHRRAVRSRVGVISEASGRPSITSSTEVLTMTYSGPVPGSNPFHVLRQPERFPLGSSRSWPAVSGRPRDHHRRRALRNRRRRAEYGRERRRLGFREIIRAPIAQREESARSAACSDALFFATATSFRRSCGRPY